ncbi:signal recognition particle GTPase [Bradyrhizobiaceae bacterium SG-6C]|nr:signal recognition particle GTPase [Bradyrhizobiaceae bacterium SG-6C]
MSESVLDRQLRLSINPKLINKNDADDASLSLFANGWVNFAATPIELAEFINEGMAFSCELAGTRKASNFVASDFLAVDIDGTRTIEDALSDPFVQDHLTILYTTPNHTSDKHRFRMVFALPRTIEAASEMKAGLRSIAFRLGGDLRATDAARIFYGSTGSNPQVFDRCLSNEILDELIAQGLNADQRDSGSTGRTATTSKLPISPDKMIQLAGGDYRRFDELPKGATIHCPFHYDLNASAFVVESKQGILGIHCSACAQTFWPPNSRRDDDFSDFDRRVEEAERYYKDMQDLGPFMRALIPAGVQYHEGLARSNIYRYESEYLKFPTPFPKGLVFIKSPKGTGKTELLKHELQDDKKSTLLIGHRTALIRQSCERLGLQCYLDFTGALQEKRLGVCVDSLHRLKWLDHITPYQMQQKENLFERIIIDESEQVLSHFLSDTIDATTRHDLFEIFCAQLRHAKTIIALDADLGWLTFETLSKLAQPRQGTSFKESTLVINDRKTAAPLQMFESREHMIGDLKQAVADGKRVFVTSNSKKLVSSLHEGLKGTTEAGVRGILVTSDTTSDKGVKAFIADPAKLALDYDAILTSPSLGTGVDITFPGREAKIDVVYGFFEAGITTHFDFDQQIWRVRHPGAVRVWISPRRFNFDTAVDVVKREIQQKQLYKSVLATYGDDMRPIYHTDDPLIDMAALARSQQLASKNNLKRHFIAMKRRHGHIIEFVESDPAIASEGGTLKAMGRLLADAAYRTRLVSAPPLDKEAFEDIEQRILDNDEIDVAERLSFARTRIERFYRQPITDELIDQDDRGQLRERIVRYEGLMRFCRQAAEGMASLDLDKAEMFGLKTRFLRDERTVAKLLYHLLTDAGIFANGRFLRGCIVTKLTLEPWMKKVAAEKPVIENMLGIEVRKDGGAGVSQLQAILGLIGLKLEQSGKTKAQSVAGGKTVYLYRLAGDLLDAIEATVKRRTEIGGWEFLENRFPSRSTQTEAGEPELTG